MLHKKLGLVLLVVLLCLAVVLMVVPPPVARAQTFTITQPDCIINFQFTATGQTSPVAPVNGLDNRNVACDTWNVTYASSGFSVVSIAIQGAPNNAGVPGAYTNGFQVQQTIIAGTNPLTSTIGGFLWATGYSPWVRILGTLTGSGVVNGAAYGWRIPSASANGTGGVATNVTVTGPLGQQAMATSVATVLPNNQTSGCTRALVNLSGSGNTQIVAASGSTKIYICDMEFSTGTPEDFKLTEGTGVNCASSTADVTGLMKNISAWSLTPAGAFAGAAGTATGGDALCANQASAQAAGVTIWFLQM